MFGDLWSIIIGTCFHHFEYVLYYVASRNIIKARFTLDNFVMTIYVYPMYKTFLDKTSYIFNIYQCCVAIRTGNTFIYLMTVYCCLPKWLLNLKHNMIEVLLLDNIYLLHIIEYCFETQILLEVQTRQWLKICPISDLE